MTGFELLQIGGRRIVGDLSRYDVLVRLELVPRAAPGQELDALLGLENAPLFGVGRSSRRCTVAGAAAEF